MSEAKKPESEDIHELKKELQASLERMQEASAGVIDEAEKLARRARDSGLMRAVRPGQPSAKPTSSITAKFEALRAPAAAMKVRA